MVGPSFRAPPRDGGGVAARSVAGYAGPGTGPGAPFGARRAASGTADFRVVPSRAGSATTSAVLSWARSWAAVGRWPGSLARQCSITGRMSAGTAWVCGSLVTTRYSSATVDPSPNGPSPVAAKVSTAPRLKTSLAGPTGRPSACSGDMNPGEPTTIPVRVSETASMDREIPKSISRGPSSARSTLAGFRSRCTTPAVWMAARPSASPAASLSTNAAGMGPRSAMASPSDGPAI